MPESIEHKQIKEVLRDFFSSHYGVAVDEYPQSGFEADVFAVLAPSIRLIVEIIWTASRLHFVEDLHRVRSFDAEIEVVVANPEILQHPSWVRLFRKIKASEIKMGHSMIGMLKWDFSDQDSVLRSLKSKIDNVLKQKGKVTSKTPLIIKTSKMGWTEALVKNLDPNLDHVYAVFFYPPEVSWRKAERNPFKRLPRFKVIVNYATKTSYWMGAHAQGLFIKGKIQYVTETGSDERDMKRWLKNKRIRHEEKPASKSDLLRKPRKEVEPTSTCK